MPKATEKADDQILAIGVTLQRQKTAMELAGLQSKHWNAYWKLSEAIWAIESHTKVSLPELRDALASNASESAANDRPEV
jgi:hypothetical protein